MCRYSGLFAAGVVVLALAVVASSIGYIAPFWTVYRYAYTREPQQLGIQYYQGSISIWSRGLWAWCFSRDRCTWFFERGFDEEKRLPDWHKAAQGLFGIGLLILLVALVIGVVHPLCRFRCNESSSLNCTMGGLCISAGVLIAIAIGVYAGNYNYYYCYTRNSVIFYWAFYVAILGAVAAIAASIVFFCASRRARYYTGYHLTI